MAAIRAPEVTPTMEHYTYNNGLKRARALFLFVGVRLAEQGRGRETRIKAGTNEEATLALSVNAQSPSAVYLCRGA